MRKLTRIVLTVCLMLVASNASAQPSHLEKLKSRYPYGLLGDDYEVLTDEDLAVNARNTLQITPFSGELNMTYSYWSCFFTRNTQIKCQSNGFEPANSAETGYLMIYARNENGIQSYLARDAMDMKDCREYVELWKQKTRGEMHVCISGLYAGLSGIGDGKRETDWVFDKFKTRKGCVSHRSECSLKELP